MMTLEQYLRVAQMWYAEQEEDYNPYNPDELNESFESIPKAGSVSDEGWVDYAEDQVNNIPDKVEEVEFDIEAFNQSLVANAALATSGENFIGRKKSAFVVPKQVKSLNSKIRNLFFRNNKSELTMG